MTLMQYKQHTMLVVSTEYKAIEVKHNKMLKI